MISITVPVHKDVKNCLPQYMKSDVADYNSLPGKFLISLLSKDVDNHYRNNKIKNVAFADEVILKVSYHTVVRDGYILQHHQAVAFNNMIKKLMKEQMRSIIVTYLFFDESITRAVQHTMARMGLHEDICTPESIIQDFKRYRQEMEKSGNDTIPRIYKKNGDFVLFNNSQS